jgi:hypothetical protein
MIPRQRREGRSGAGGMSPMMPEGAPPVDIHLAIASVQADAARIARYTDRRDRFLDALDWSALDEQTAREAAMLDDLLAGDLADAALYILWLEERLASGETDVPGVLRFYPHPRPGTAVDLAALTLKGSP